MRPGPLEELFPDLTREQWREEGFAFGEVTKEAIYLLPNGRTKVRIPPPPPQRNHGNEVVSVARFAEVLWRDGGTGRSTGSLPVYIANLRRLLEPERPARTPPERILTRAPGYLLQVGPGEYDVADFEWLSAEGSRHLAEGRPRAARSALGEALSLWRGRALEEFPFAEMDAARLETLRAATRPRPPIRLRRFRQQSQIGSASSASSRSPMRRCDG